MSQMQRGKEDHGDDPSNTSGRPVQLERGSHRCDEGSHQAEVRQVGVFRRASKVLGPGNPSRLRSWSGSSNRQSKDDQALQVL